MCVVLGVICRDGSRCWRSIMAKGWLSGGQYLAASPLADVEDMSLAK